MLSVSSPVMAVARIDVRLTFLVLKLKFCHSRVDHMRTNVPNGPRAHSGGAETLGRAMTWDLTVNS